MIEYGILVERIEDDSKPPVLIYQFFGPDDAPEIIYRQEAVEYKQTFGGPIYHPLEEEAARVQVMNKLFRDGGWQYKSTEPRGVVTYNASGAPYTRPDKVFLTFERTWDSDD